MLGLKRRPLKDPAPAEPAEGLGGKIAAELGQARAALVAARQRRAVAVDAALAGGRPDDGTGAAEVQTAERRVADLEAALERAGARAAAEAQGAVLERRKALRQAIRAKVEQRVALARESDKLLRDLAGRLVAMHELGGDLRRLYLDHGGPMRLDRFCPTEDDSNRSRLALVLLSHGLAPWVDVEPPTLWQAPPAPLLLGDLEAKALAVFTDLPEDDPDPAAAALEAA